MERGKNEPDESDYSAFSEMLSKTQQAETVKGNIAHVRKYYAWLSHENAPVPVVEGAKNEGASREKRTHRFSLMFYPSLIEGLNVLADFDRCSVSELIIRLCEECVSERAKDIEYYREEKQRREAYKKGAMP